jgi:hypothetical protein
VYQGLKKRSTCAYRGKIYAISALGQTGQYFG